MNYSLEPKEVKKVIDAKLAGRFYDEKQFLYYHVNRNHFNVKNEISTLKRIGEKRYMDNLGFVWEEVSALKNFFHMPKVNWMSSVIGLDTPYSRKFLRDDTVSALAGEFEMIIRHDGKRIDALTNEDFQETYNFGRTRNSRDHFLLDVETHNKHSNYSFKMDMGKVIITE